MTKDRKNIYFISDVHLKFVRTPEETEKQYRFVSFLKSIRDDAAALYIVGDLFDFWFEWYHVIPKYWFNVFYHFSTLIKAGIPVHFVSGNHDFYFNDYLNDEIGFICHDEKMAFEIEIGSGKKKFLVAHGDGYAKKDRGYRLLKKLIRSRFAIFMFKTFIPPDIGMWIAKKTSETSGKHRNDGPDWQAEYFDFARSRFDEGFDYVILGHLHKPVRQELGGKVYLNCGDWLNSFSYGLFDGEDLQIKFFE